MKKLINFFKQPNKKKVISFDGGGVRAIAGLVFLRKLETETGIKVFDTFDMFIGTSAGSFNAACFACNGLSADEVKKYWSKDYLDKIMKSSFFWDKASLIQARPRYENKGRVGVLNEIFADKLLSESSKPLVTLCYDIEKRTHVIHSSFETPEITFIDAVSSSSAAPMYFPPYKTQGGSWMIDGGVVTNNPVLVGASHAKKFFQTDDIKILSIGAGLNKQKISGEDAGLWGGVGWLRNDLMAMMLDAEIHDTLAKDTLGKNYLRINSPIGKINKILDDDSELNIEKIHLMGLEWWSEFGEEAVEFLKD
ncbi:MAG: patatin-like phospholipase/acyl hydrolase [Gammaproteobacteria bacterium]|jgi:patatin-like phospholipase/acyl hydrolase|tara:strand:- start:255 stop:1178 length:924 start_codon:yes stop_codon:yes gene_type:complete